MPTDSVYLIAQKSRESAAEFLERAGLAETPKEAADWSLAAKNSMQVALTSEQIVKTRNAR